MHAGAQLAMTGSGSPVDVSFRVMQKLSLAASINSNSDLRIPATFLLHACIDARGRRRAFASVHLEPISTEWMSPPPTSDLVSKRTVYPTATSWVLSDGDERDMPTLRPSLIPHQTLTRRPEFPPRSNSAHVQVDL